MRNRLLRKNIAAALAAGTVLCAGQAWAAEDPDILDRVTITAERVVQTVADTPANVTVITGEELKNKGARTLADALTGVSGVSVRSYGGRASIAIPYLLGTDRIVVLVDGKRMNVPQGIGYGSGGIDLNTIMLADNIDRIEIVQGGASALYGADAVGGVVNIITKKGEGATKTTATAAAGNHGTRQLSLDASGQEKNTRWRLSGGRDSTDGQRTNSAYEGKNLSFRLDQDLAKDESLAFTYDFYDSHFGIPGSLTYPSSTNYGDILRRNWSVGYTKDHADGSRTFRYYTNNQVYSGDTSGSFRHENTVRAFEYQDSARLNAVNLLTWGSEWRQDEVKSTSASSVPHSGITKALYVQDQYSFNQAAKLTVGLRRDDSSLYGTHWLPKAAYLFQANAKTSYFANWGRVFKAPSFDDLYGDDGWGDTGDPNLKPEHGWTADTGVKTRLSKASEATLTFFYRDLNDAIRWTKASDGTYHPHNIDSLTSRGVTASVTSKLSAAVTAEYGYTYLNSYNQNGVDVGDPRHSFNVGLNMRHGKLTQKICGLYEAKTGMDSDSSRVAGRFIVNTNTTFNLTKDTAVFLTVNNLFDREYQGKSGYPADRRTVLLGIKQSL